MMILGCSVIAVFDREVSRPRLTMSTRLESLRQLTYRGRPINMPLQPDLCDDDVCIFGRVDHRRCRILPQPRRLAGPVFASMAGWTCQWLYVIDDPGFVPPDFSAPPFSVPRRNSFPFLPLFSSRTYTLCTPVHALFPHCRPCFRSPFHSFIRNTNFVRPPTSLHYNFSSFLSSV